MSLRASSYGIFNTDCLVQIVLTLEGKGNHVWKVEAAGVDHLP